MNIFLIILIFFSNSGLEKARELYEKGIYLEAIYYLNEYLKKYPKNKEAQNLKTKIFLELNLVDSLQKINNPSYRFSKIKKENKIIKKEIVNYSEILLKARKAKEAGDYFKSLNFYEDFLKKDTNDKKVFYEIAQVAGWLGFLNKAIFYYKKYLNYFPQDKKGLYELGLIYSWNGNYEKALTILDNLEKETSDVKVRLAKANIYEWQGNYLNSFQIYQQLKNLYPENEDIFKKYEKLKNMVEKKKEKYRWYSFSPLFSYQQTNWNWKRFLSKSSFQFSWNKLSSTIFYEWQQCEEKESLRIINKLGLINKISLLENIYFGVNAHYWAIKWSDDLVLYSCGLNYQIPRLIINLEYNKKPIWEEVFKINTCYNLITSDDIFGVISYKPFNFLGFEGSYRYALYHDENELNNGNFRLFFLFLDNLKCGYHYYFLSYRKAKKEYWSPQLYGVHSIFLNIFNENWETFFQIGKPFNSRFLEKNFSLAFKLRLAKDFYFLITGRYGETYYYKIGEINLGINYLW